MAASAGQILFDLVLIILGAKLGGEAAERIKQPAVLGELLVGILLSAGLLGGFVGLPDLSLGAQAAEVQAGNDPLTTGVFYLQHGHDVGAVEILELLAALGAILLLFEVGLESKIKDLRKVGVSSILVAVIGIVVSFAVGFAASWGLAEVWSVWHAADEVLPMGLLHVFMGAAMTATSVGITARVLADMKRLRSPESRIILGAAVLDDIGGLIILAVVAALVTAAQGGGAVDALTIVRIAGTAIAFLAVALIVGLRFVPRAYDALADRFRVAGFPVALALAFALLMAYLASLAGLADIVGAFAGGLLLAETRHGHRIFTDLRPLAAIFVGFFFVTLGMHVDVREFVAYAGPVLLVGTGLAILAILAKLACGLGVVRGQAHRLPVGVGMVPRGEVGLIFASLGLSTGLLANWQYALLLYVVLITTFITPMWLGRLQGSFQVESGPPSGQGMAQVLEV